MTGGLPGPGLAGMDAPLMRRAKEWGFSDRRLALLTGSTEEEVRAHRLALGVTPTYKRVDTCAAEFEAFTPYLYSTYESECEAQPTDRQKIMILGGGPNRIGQGIEFDYCCVHGSYALKEDGYETIMVNCNPETVSTDFDTSDRLYFEPLTLEDVLNIVELEKPAGIILQFGGQTPLKLSQALERHGCPILGTSSDSIDRAEDRDRFIELVNTLGLRQPANGTALTEKQAEEIAARIGYPVVVRPSYVLGGRGMEIVYTAEELRRYMSEAVEVSFEHPVLIDRFLRDAQEIDVDALCDGAEVILGGIMEHIEEAGVHSGDSACSLPPYSLSAEVLEEVAVITRALALELGVVGLLNIQLAVQGGLVYLLEVNPRASRTVPFVSKATGLPLAKAAARLMTGKTLAELGIREQTIPTYISVKEAVFPFNKLPGADTILGPEMKSTGEVMGIGRDFPQAFALAQAAAGANLPGEGCVFISVKDADKETAVALARDLRELGFTLAATPGTHHCLAESGISSCRVERHHEARPSVLDMITNGEIDLVINTTEATPQVIRDSYYIRRAALNYRLPYFTTVQGARAAVAAISSLRDTPPEVCPLQEYHSRPRA